MAKFTCPYCYGEHTLLDCGIKCSYNIPGTNKDCVKGLQKEPGGWIPARYKNSCMNCKDASKLIYCKVVDREIPRDFLSGTSLPIALLGAKASGKSNYIGVLVNEIRKKMAITFNCMLSTTSSEESKKYYDMFYKEPLYDHKVVVNATDKVEIPPLIFPLRFLDQKNRIKNTATLTFYDTAGEALDSKEDMLVYNRYVPNSKGIILLLDPLQVDSIRAQLNGKVDLPNKNTDVYDILNRIIDNIRDVKNIRGKINIPLAIAFTKLDVLEKFDILPQGSCMREESEHLKNGVFVNSDFEAVNNEMNTLLQNWLDADLLQLLQCFNKSAFFGVSALGCAPSGNSVGNGVQPKRILDPLLWLLAENNYIKRVK